MRDHRLWLLVLLCATVACGAAGGNSGVPTDEPEATASTATTPPAAAPPTEQGATKNFISLDYLRQVPYAYRVANEHPEVLEQIPCYCPCMLYGHGSVIDCYRSQHAAACSTCLEEGVLAGQLIEEMGPTTDAEYAEVAAQVKRRYRDALVQSYVQRGERPNLQSAGGRAYLEACSACHQPAHPAMYTTDSWRQPLARMEQYANQGEMPDPQVWQQAIDYVRSTAGQFPPEAGNEYRATLATQVEHLKAAEGDSAYYPSPQDKVLSPEWFERMVRAYRLAQDIPAAALAAVEIEDPACSNLLDCLNSTAAVTSEAAVEAVFQLAAERGIAEN